MNVFESEKRYSTLCRVGVLLGVVMLVAGCTTSMPKNKYHAHSRSTFIQSDTAEQAVLAKAKLTVSSDAAVNNIRVLEMSGTPYEMGFQHGRLLKKDVQENIGRIYSRLGHFIEPEILDEAYALMEPYIPIEDKMEMMGLAHGADIPLRVVQRIHAVPEMSEYKHKKQFSKSRVLLATSCSNVAAFGSSTKDGEVYSMRILDWVRELGAQNYAAVLVYRPDVGNHYVSFSYAGFVGCITGMNDKHITFGEMGYGNRPEETLEGVPFVFLFKKLLRESNSVDDALSITRSVPRTCSYAYLFADGINKDAKLLISNKNDFTVYSKNETLKDEESYYPAMEDLVYGGAKDEALHTALKDHYGTIDAQAMQAIAKPSSLTSNMQIIIMKPKTLEAWIANAADGGLLDGRSEEGRACNQKYFYIDLKDL